MKYAQLIDEIERADQAKDSILEISDTKLPGVEWKAGSRFPPVHLRFTRVCFEGDVCFKSVTFQAGASFIDVDFEGEVSFASCHFKGPAYFWKCRFGGDCDFSHVVVACENFPESKYDAGEANFSYSIFYKQAQFRHAVFNGPTYFWRTVFKREVDFEVTQFRGATQFMGLQHDILIAERELPEDMPRPKEKEKTGILCACEDRSGYYNFNPDIKSVRELRVRLHLELSKPSYIYRVINRILKSERLIIQLGRFNNKYYLPVIVDSAVSKMILQVAQARILKFMPEISEKTLLFKKEDSEKIVELWLKYHGSYMFNTEYVSKFTESYLGPKSEFRYVSLRKCQFRRADLSNVRFDSVGWDRGPRDRVRIHDDLDLEQSIKNYSDTSRTVKTEDDWVYRESIAVSHLYHQLRLRADVAGERSLARSFYYGEMEMARRAEATRRLPVLATIYMHLSGYGTQELRALLILLVLLLGLWPCFYLLLSLPLSNYRQSEFWRVTVPSNVLSSEVTSLEAATFLVRPAAEQGKNTDSGYARRIAESIERITVSIQAGLFVLSLKSKFQRGPE